MENLIEQVKEWSIARGINQAESSKQMLKVIEEIGEVAAALVRDDDAKLKDGIGDVVVTLIILAQQNNLELHDCLQLAYDEIKDRTGREVNGIFVKTSDLGDK